MPLVSYVFANDVGANKAGDVVQMEPEQAQPLVDAGLLAEATEEDVNGGAETPTDEPVEEEAAITRAISTGFKKLEESLVKVAKATPAKPNVGNFATPKEPVFKTTGDIVRACYRAKSGDVRAVNMLHQHQMDIMRKSPAGMSEGSNSAGGYAVVPTWADEIFAKVKNYPRLLDMCNKFTISGSTFNIPAVDETSLADGSRGGGIRAYWVSEGGTGTTSYPAMTQVQSIINTQVVLIPVTNQLLEDNSYNLDSFLAEKVGEEFTWAEDYAVISGAGTTQPKGILNQASLITVTKESSQTATTINFPNISKMWARLWPGSRAGAVWLANPQVWQQLVAMTFPNAAGTVSAYGNVSFNAHDEFPLRIFGKPVIECLMAPALGQVGDIILCDLKQLWVAEHAGLQVAVSDQVYFTSLQTLFRFVRRYDAQSPWTAAVTSLDGGTSYSPFVALQTRT